MKKPVRITINKETPKGELTSYSTSFEIIDTTTVSELKTTIRESIKFPYDLVKETLWGNSTELKDEDVISKNGRIEYTLLIK